MALALGGGIAALLGILGSLLVGRRLSHAMRALSAAALALGRGEPATLPSIPVREPRD